MKAETTEDAIWRWKTKKLIKQIEEARGNGTSMISLLIPPKKQISDVQRLLTEEYGTAQNIKSRVNRLSVLSAIATAQAKLKLYHRTPENGLIIYAGEVSIGGAKEKKVCMDIVPFKPLNKFYYMCDNRFHTEELSSLFEDDKTYGFLIIDGRQCLWGLLSGSRKTVLNKITVDLPKKHGRGGQSAARFGRIRMEKRHNYLTKVAGLTTQYFIEGDKPIVAGIILAGLAEFKKDLKKADLLDHRLQPLILSLVDVSYGGVSGFNQAIEKSATILSEVTYLEEKKLLQEFFEEIELDTGKYCYGQKDVMYALDNGAIEKLIVWEDLPLHHLKLKSKEGDVTKNIIVDEKQRSDPEILIDKENGLEFIVEEEMSLLEYLTIHHKDGLKLSIITDRSTEGTQFVKGFGGIGGIMRWELVLDDVDDVTTESDDEDDFM